MQTSALRSEQANARTQPTVDWGVAAKPLWSLEECTRYINHGGFGATPVEVAADRLRWIQRMERNPARFFLSELPVLLREAAAPLARFVGTAPQRLGFVTNATAGMNAVLRSFDFVPGDEIITTDHVYNAVRNALRYVGQRSGARVIEAPVGVPVARPAQVLDAIIGSFTARTRLVVADHVASASAVTFPVREIAVACRARGIPLLVDGAHGPGILDLEIDEIGADWYVGNCHKWLCAPKSAGFIVVAEHAATDVHPLAISHAYGQGFVAEFDKIGTHDASAALSVPAAIQFHERLGGVALRARNHRVATDAGLRLAAELGTELGASPELFQAMATVRLPCRWPATRESVGVIHDRLYLDHRIEAGIMALAGSLWLRISAQAYNDEGDYDGLGAAVRAVLQETPS